MKSRLLWIWHGWEEKGVTVPEQRNLSACDLCGALTIPDQAPLWFYCLAEAQMLGGTRLGPVAGAIVSEALVGILLADPDNWLNQDPLWMPTLGATPGTFTMSDLITIASAG